MTTKVASPKELIGTDSGISATINEFGSIQPSSGDYQVEWWVGEGGRWYKPESETVFSHKRIGTAPVFETRLIISTGQITATTWATIGREVEEPSVVTEILNESNTPVALAIVVTPFGGIERLRVEENSLVIDESSQITIDRPSGYYVLQEELRDLENEIFNGQATKEVPTPLRSRKKNATGALVVPLIHKSGLRFAITPTAKKMIEPGNLPNSSRVEAGWGQRLKTGATVRLPTSELGGSDLKGLVDLLISNSTPEATIRLAAWGLADDASERIASADPNPQWLNAAIELWVRHRRVEDFLSSTAIKIEPLVRSLGKGDVLGQVSTDGLVSLLRALGEDRAAGDLERLNKGFPGSPLRPFDDLVFESSEGIQLLTKSLPRSWYGQDFELHGLATRWGNLGFAVRWHGKNAALLWEIEPHGNFVPLITIPGLSMEFSTSEPEGETLLTSLLSKD
ncbi:MAG TPA: hypothetical protein QF762_01140 [Acidimicrobiales bacterium]|nr:hypothetical protein [Acidimicrobiales bacterium]|tara:strand:- start:673 stop:2034 length:1362 start_codon:yes stop_codon:yes gene_type:complete